MTPQDERLIQATADFVQQALSQYDAAHDWAHIERVWNNAKLINHQANAPQLVVELGALLHDIAD